VFDGLHKRSSQSPTNIAVIGLGAGSLACYARPTEDWTFYEINPAVEQIARDDSCFTFMSRSNAKTLRVVLGDARLQLKGAPDHGYNLIIADAFSSDSIPVHLLTREAFRLYDAKLAAGGLLAFHISNRRLNLEPVVASLASDGGLVAFYQQDTLPGPSGKENSEWAVISRRTQDVQPLLGDDRWHSLVATPQARVWTDDFTNILGVLRWR
jgi:spermidine synthase